MLVLIPLLHFTSLGSDKIGNDCGEGEEEGGSVINSGLLETESNPWFDRTRSACRNATAAHPKFRQTELRILCFKSLKSSVKMSGNPVSWFSPKPLQKRNETNLFPLLRKTASPHDHFNIPFKVVKTNSVAFYLAWWKKDSLKRRKEQQFSEVISYSIFLSFTLWMLLRHFCFVRIVALIFKRMEFCVCATDTLFCTVADTKQKEWAMICLKPGERTSGTVEKGWN